MVFPRRVFRRRRKFNFFFFWKNIFSISHRPPTPPSKAKDAYLPSRPVGAGSMLRSIHLGRGCGGSGRWVQMAIWPDLEICRSAQMAIWARWVQMAIWPELENCQNWRILQFWQFSNSGLDLVIFGMVPNGDFGLWSLILHLFLASILIDLGAKWRFWQHAENH